MSKNVVKSGGSEKEEIKREREVLTSSENYSLNTKQPSKI